jgi:hypothetical protein
MGPDKSVDRAGSSESAAAAQFNHEAPAGEVPAWEEVEAGRYMPRRIRGSCKGRALG